MSKRNESANKPFYKQWWFWVIVVVVIGALGNLGDSEKKTEVKKENEQTKISSTEPKKSISLELGDSFETDNNGVVTINGKTEPKAKVQIGFGVMNEPIVADDLGNFELQYTLKKEKEENINIMVSLDKATNSKDVTIKPSQEFLATKQAPAESQQANTTSVPMEYKTALRKAESYSKMMYMSKAGLYDQLTSEYGEKFSPEAAQYAIDTINADWNANALAKAKSYQETMAMSPEGIRDQLMSEHGEKFTPEEADYAVQHLNE